MRYSLGAALLLTLALAACGGDDTTAAVDDDATTAGSGGATASSTNAGPTSSSAAGTGGGGSSLECFDFSNDPDLPLAVPSTFAAASERWRRPHDEDPVCPATALTPEGSAEVPRLVTAFCNNDTVAHTYDFEMIADSGPAGEAALDDPYLFLYQGVGVPADPLQCLAVNDDIPDALDTKDAEILGIEVPPGGAITVVSTTYTFDPTDGTGTGYAITVVTNAD